MKKKAEQLKKGDNVVVAGKKCIVQTIEISDIGKQGVKKCRIELKTPEGEKVVIVRPSDYPLDAE